MALIKPQAVAVSHGTGTASYLADGTRCLQWSSGTNQIVGMYVSFDLGSAQAVYAIRQWVCGVYMNTDYPRAFSILASNTGAFGGEETTVTTGTASQGGAVDTLTGTATPYRYWRIRLTSGVSSYWRLTEVEFHADSSTLTTVPVATASQNSSTAYYVNDPTTAWQWTTGAGQAIGQYLNFDLGSARSIGTVRQVCMFGSNASTDYPRSYEILASNTGTFGGEEVQVATRSPSGAGLYDDTPNTATPYRYWRIRLTANWGANWWRCNMVQFFAATLPVMTASNTYAGTLPAFTAFEDTDAVAQWKSGTDQVSGMWLQADFGAAVSRSTLLIDCAQAGADYPRSFEVVVSNTGTFGGEEVQAGTGTASSVGLIFVHLAAGGAFRYWRIRLTASVSGKWWATSRVVFYDATLVAPLASLNSGAAAYAFDGYGATTFSSGVTQAIGAWLGVDLGAPTMVDALAVTCGHATDYPRTWDVEASATGAWAGEQVTAGTGSLAGPGTYTTSFTATTARYWRMRLTSNSGNWWQVDDFAVSIVPPPPPPDAPSDLTATATAFDTIHLTWTDNASNEAGFKIQRAPDSSGSPGTWADLDDVGVADTEDYDDTTCSELTKYWYRVCAYNAGGNSAWSDPASDTTPAANTPPTAPTITLPTDGATVGLTFTLAVTSGTDPDVGQTLTDYYRTRLNAGTWSGWSVIAGTASVTSAAGTLDIEAKTNDSIADGPADSVTVTVVAGPTGPTVTDVDVNYNFASIVGSAYSGDSPQGGRRFKVYASDGVTVIWNSDWVTPPSTTYPDIPLAPNTTYYATVQDKDSLGQETAESAQVEFTTGDYPKQQVTQAGLAVVVADSAPAGRVTQAYAEAALQKTGYAEARVTQVILETMLPHASLVYQSYPCCLLLEHYKRDGTTVEWSVTTAPNQPNSYLRDPAQDGSGYAAQECDFLEGRASIGSVKVCVIDAAFSGGDQQDRWLTNKLATSGQGAIRGHRERLRRFISPALGWVTVADGPAGSPRLRPSFSGYEWEIRDTRERERGLKAFSGRANLSIMPRGPISNWGNKGDGTYLLSAVTPLTGVYHQAGWLDFSAYLTPSDWTNSSAVADDRIIITDSVRKAGEITSSTFVGPTVADYQHEYANLQIWWRVPPSTDWNKQTDLSVVGVGLNFFEYASGTYKDDDGNTVSAAAHLLTLRRFGTAPDGSSFATEPGEGASVEMLIVYTGPVSEDFPLYLETTDGALLKDCYDGDYTPDVNGDPTPTGILYDSAALARLTHPVLARITEPADNLREWTEKNIYVAIGHVPAFDNYLRISPASQVTPADTSGLIDLTNAITAPQPTWQHGDKIINILRFKYRRFYPDPTGEAADGIAVREITQEFRNEDSIALHGEQELEIDTEAFGAVGGTAGEALGSEEGNILAQARHEILFPRYVNGTPTATLKCFRSATYALRPGSLVKLSPTWMPEYATGLRGMASIGQVLEARDLNCAWREFTVEVVPQTHAGSFALGGGGGLSFTTTQG